MTVVVASEPPRLCKPGEWSDNAATRFTVLYHPFCLTPLCSRSLARALVPFHTICNFPTSHVPPSLVLSRDNDDGAARRLFLSSDPHREPLYLVVCTRPRAAPLHSQRVRTLRRIRAKRLSSSNARIDARETRAYNDTCSQRILAELRGYLYVFMLHHMSHSCVIVLNFSVL